MSRSFKVSKVYPLWHCSRDRFVGVSISSSSLPRTLLQFYIILSHELHLGGEFDDCVSLSWQAKRDLNWIICHLNIKCYYGKSFKQLPIDLVIVCDASNSGWGAVCEGIETHGEWSLERLELHINPKELLVAFFAVSNSILCKECPPHPTENWQLYSCR